MASLRVFVSSTCYDLAVMRGQLRQFIEDLGHEPVMSDYNDVVYDYRTHTHTACIDEVAGADVVVVIIGARFGGKVIPQALQKVDIESLKTISKSHDILKTKDNISITQLEVLKAIERSIPVFAFVDERVMNDHATYEKNKTKSIADEIEYNSIEKPETAKYVFEFINFLRHRSTNNAVSTFSRPQDIEDNLRRQWSGMLQRLLFEQRSRVLDGRRIDALTQQFEDLKTAILAAVGGSKNEKEIARGVVRYRRLIDFVRAFQIADLSLITGAAVSWQTFMQSMHVNEIVQLPPDMIQRAGIRRPTWVMVRDDGTIYEVDRFFDPMEMAVEWEAFMLLSPESRQVIVDALVEMRTGLPLRRYVQHLQMTLEDYLTPRLRPDEQESTSATE